MRKVLYIVNPAGHGGSGMKTWSAFREAWGTPIDPDDVCVTTGPGHARRLAAEANNYQVVTAVGGDGTVGEVISGLLDRGAHRQHVAIVPGGTGNDIARNLGMGTVEAALSALRGGEARSLDVLRVECQSDGERRLRYAFLYGSAGFSSLPLVRPWMKRWLGPAIAYNVATLRTILSFRAPKVSVQSADTEFEGRSWMVTAGNTERISGGSVCMSPGAIPDDGLMEVAIYPNRPRLAMLTRLFPKIPSGAQVNEPDVAYFRTPRIQVEMEPPMPVEVDGDLLGVTPAAIEVIARAVTILCPR